MQYHSEIKVELAWISQLNWLLQRLLEVCSQRLLRIPTPFHALCFLSNGHPRVQPVWFLNINALLEVELCEIALILFGFVGRLSIVVWAIAVRNSLLDQLIILDDLCLSLCILSFGKRTVGIGLGFIGLLSEVGIGVRLVFVVAGIARQVWRRWILLNNASLGRQGQLGIGSLLKTVGVGSECVVGVLSSLFLLSKILGPTRAIAGQHRRGLLLFPLHFRRRRFPTAHNRLFDLSYTLEWRSTSLLTLLDRLSVLFRAFAQDLSRNVASNHERLRFDFLVEGVHRPFLGRLRCTMTRFSRVTVHF